MVTGLSYLLIFKEVDNAYTKGVNVTYKAKKWTSTADGNAWEPGAAGVYESIWKGVI